RCSASPRRRGSSRRSSRPMAEACSASTRPSATRPLASSQLPQVPPGAPSGLRHCTSTKTAVTVASDSRHHMQKACSEIHAARVRYTLIASPQNDSRHSRCQRDSRLVPGHAVHAIARYSSIPQNVIGSPRKRDQRLPCTTSQPESSAQKAAPSPLAPLHVRYAVSNTPNTVSARSAQSTGPAGSLRFPRWLPAPCCRWRCPCFLPPISPVFLLETPYRVLRDRPCVPSPHHVTGRGGRARARAAGAQAG